MNKEIYLIWAYLFELKDRRINATLATLLLHFCGIPTSLLSLAFRNQKRSHLYKVTQNCLVKNTVDYIFRYFFRNITEHYWCLNLKVDKKHKVDFSLHLRIMYQQPNLSKVTLSHARYSFWAFGFYEHCFDKVLWMGPRLIFP